jgi:16S rRNA (adenine1518-N6/adenine1519-N6)-dimethyltransferase
MYIMQQKLPSLKDVIAKHGLFTRKSLGQHFLLDNSITNKIVLYAGDLVNHNVIEVGPGPGGLTRSLLAAGAKSLTVVEKDDRCIAIMEELKEAVDGDDRMHILHGDALKIDLQEAVAAPRKIVANLPYNVGTIMLLHWLDDIAVYGAGAYSSLTLMFQEEVAQRIIAAPDTSEYGRLSVVSQFLCECRYDFKLPPEAFSPPPKVHSAVITLTPRPEPLYPVSKAMLEKVVAAAFGQRRKMLRSALRQLGVPVEKLLERAGIDGTLRAEVLDVATFCRLTQAFEEMTGGK